MPLHVLRITPPGAAPRPPRLKPGPVFVASGGVKICNFSKRPGVIRGRSGAAVAAAEKEPAVPRRLAHGRVPRRLLAGIPRLGQGQRRCGRRRKGHGPLLRPAAAGGQCPVRPVRHLRCPCAHATTAHTPAPINSTHTPTNAGAERQANRRAQHARELDGEQEPWPAVGHPAKTMCLDPEAHSEALKRSCTPAQPGA